MPRYALLRHECPSDFKPSHWDLMLEMEGLLATWELPELPAAWAEALGLEQRDVGSPITVTRLPDHRLAYLSYEGPISGSRGSVTQAATGSFEIIESRSDRLIARLRGVTLDGMVTLIRLRDSDVWELVV